MLIIKLVNPYTHFEVDVRFVSEGVLTVNGRRVGSFDVLTRSAWSFQDDYDEEYDDSNQRMLTSPTTPTMPAPRTLHDLERFLRAELSRSGHNHWFPVAFNGGRARHTFALRRYSALHAEEQYHELRLHTQKEADQEDDEMGEPMELDPQTPSRKKRPITHLMTMIGGGGKRRPTTTTIAAAKTANA